MDLEVLVPEKLCECGCGEPAPIAVRTNTKLGWTQGQPKRFVNGHSRRTHPRDYEVDENGCWIWMRYRNPKGYGQARRNGGTVLAHRAYYEDVHGPLEPYAHLHHLCEVPHCVNPEHVAPVTPAEHRQAHPLKLDWDKVKMIRESSLSSRKLGAILGVSHRMVLDVRNHKNWKVT